MPRDLSTINPLIAEPTSRGNRFLLPESIDCRVDHLDLGDGGTWRDVPGPRIDRHEGKTCMELTADNLPLLLPWQWEECHV